jgi:hypothetical protein
VEALFNAQANTHGHVKDGKTSVVGYGTDRNAARSRGDYSVSQILLASATLPGVFAPVRIEVRVGEHNYDELHVDGGVTRQVFLAPSVFGLVPPQQKPGMLTSRRLYVIRNGKISPEWQSVDEKVLSVTQRSLSTLI